MGVVSIYPKNIKGVTHIVTTIISKGVLQTITIN